MRSWNRTTTDSHFPSETIEEIWMKAEKVKGVDSDNRRKDFCGAWIDKDQFGVCVEGGMGWEIDHILPIALGGQDNLSNLQPLHWQNNRAKGDKLPGEWECAIFNALFK